MVENDKSLVIFKMNSIVKIEVLHKIREEITSQLETGVVLCNASIERIKLNSVSTIYDVFVSERKEINQ